MTFFNRKEEVLDIELTQYGKFLLSRGKWKPAYYAFFDDDITYDISWTPGQPSELQNLSESRIKEAARSHTQHVFHSVESDQQNWNIDPEEDFEENIQTIGRFLQQRPDRHFVNASPLGTAQIGNQHAPAWNIIFLKGDITSSFIAATGPLRPMVNIPQINTEIIYQTAVGNPFNFPFEADPYPDEFAGLHEDTGGEPEFPDGTFIQVKEDFILLDVEEVNGLTANKDFEIEVFKLETDTRTGEEILNPLAFIDTGDSSLYEITEDDVLVKRNLNPKLDYKEITKRNVSYFMEINTDAEIDNRILCDLDPRALKRSVFSAKFADCENVEDRQRENIYGPEEEFEDPCEE